MEPRTLELLVDGDATRGWVVRSPAVGLWSEIPEDGLAIDGAHAGLLAQGHRRHRLRLPAGVRGVVRDSPRVRVLALAVEWGQTLFRLEPIGERSAQAAQAGAAAGSTTNVFPAPTDGVFYARPTPTAAPFVKPGDTLRRGQTVGLIEVMKTFNQILFEGHGWPDEVRVEAVLVEDGAEVRAGDALLRLESG